MFKEEKAILINLQFSIKDFPLTVAQSQRGKQVFEGHNKCNCHPKVGEKSQRAMGMWPEWTINLEEI